MQLQPTSTTIYKEFYAKHESLYLLLYNKAVDKVAAILLNLFNLADTFQTILEIRLELISSDRNESWKS